MKGGVKTGEKHYARHEERRASRQAQQLSRTFNLTKLGRNCLLYSPGIVNKPVVNPVVVQTGMNWNRRTPRRSVPFGMRMTCQQTRFISAMRKQPKLCNVWWMRSGLRWQDARGVRIPIELAVGLPLCASPTSLPNGERCRRGPAVHSRAAVKIQGRAQLRRIGAARRAGDARNRQGA